MSDISKIIERNYSLPFEDLGNAIISGKTLLYHIPYSRSKEAIFDIYDGLELKYRDQKIERVVIFAYCNYPSFAYIKVMDFGLDNLDEIIRYAKQQNLNELNDEQLIRFYTKIDREKPNLRL